MFAASNGHTDIVRTLLAHGAEIDAVDALGESALVQAALLGRVETVEELRARGASSTPSEDLLFAARVGRTEEAATALGRGADPGISDSRGLTALMIASLRGHLGTVRLLIAEGAEVNRQSREGVPVAVQSGTIQGGGVTALMLASAEGHRAIVEALLRAGGPTLPWRARSAGRRF